MKLRLLHIRLLACSASLAGVLGAHAQSSVTIYGIADVYGEGIKGASKLVRQQSGGASGSRLGFRGQEELAGGLSAIFDLEAGINFDDGSNAQNAVWGRQSYLGLKSTSWGQLSLGRQYSSIYSVTTDFSEFSNNPVGASTALIGGFGGYEPVRGANDSATGNGGPDRVSNSVRYESASWYGLRFGALAGLGEVAGQTGENRLLDTWARYESGPVALILSIVDDKGGTVHPTAHRRTVSTAGAYAFGDARVLAGYLDVDDRSIANRGGKGWWGGADYRWGAHLLKAQYVQNQPDHVNDAKSHAFGVGYEYSLSKRATLYSSLARFENDSGAGLGRAAFSIPTGLTTATDNDLTQFVGGFRLLF